MKTIKNKITVIFVYLPVILFSLIFTPGCTSFGEGLVTGYLEPPIVKSHLWDYMGKETEGYAMYTYVLFHRGKNQDYNFHKRYELLISLIQSSTASVQDYSPEDFEKPYFNLFLIQNGSNNQYLSKNILTKLSLITDDNELRKSLLNPGPFLVSIKKPIGTAYKDKKTDEVLYVDLTNTNEAAMEEVVMAYKKRLIEDGVDGSGRFKSLKLSLLDLILDADDYITIVKTAYADILPDWSK